MLPNILISEEIVKYLHLSNFIMVIIKCMKLHIFIQNSLKTKKWKRKENYIA